jgi:cathepsin D
VWTGTVSVGTPPVPFKIKFDTGNRAFWVPDITCETCGYRTRYNWDASSTGELLGIDFNLGYHDGCKVDGILYTETVTIADLTITELTFGSVMHAAFRVQGLEDGILGLGFHSVSDFKAPLVFQTLIDKNLVDSPVFAMKLQDPGMDSELTLGGLNPDLYTGPITYTDVVEPALLWEIFFGSLNIGGQEVVSISSCIIDSVCSNHSLLTT